MVAQPLFSFIAYTDWQLRTEIVAAAGTSSSKDQWGSIVVMRLTGDSCNLPATPDSA